MNRPPVACPWVGYPPFRFSLRAKENWTQDRQDTIVSALVEPLIKTGPESMASVFTELFNPAMQMERDQFLGAGLHERSEERRGYANGYKPKKVDAPAGTVAVQVP